MNEAIDKELYNKVKKQADLKFASNGIYKSSWIVREYSKLGGKYKGVKPKLTGLKRWYQERWIDLNTGKSCGRKSANIKGNYPLCRPSIRVTKQTPLTVDEINKNNLKELFKLKNKYGSQKNVKFNKK